MDELSDIVWAAPQSQQQQPPQPSPNSSSSTTGVSAAFAGPSRPLSPATNTNTTTTTTSFPSHSRSASPAAKNDAFGGLISLALARGGSNGSASGSGAQQAVPPPSLDEQRRLKQQQQPQLQQPILAPSYRPAPAQSSLRPIAQSAAITSVPTQSAFADIASFASAAPASRRTLSASPSTTPTPQQTLSLPAPSSSKPLTPTSYSISQQPQQQQNHLAFSSSASGTTLQQPAAKNASAAFADLLSAPNAPKMPVPMGTLAAANTGTGAGVGLAAQRNSATTNSVQPFGQSSPAGLSMAAAAAAAASTTSSTAWGNIDFLASGTKATHTDTNHNANRPALAQSSAPIASAAPNTTSSAPSFSGAGDDVFDVSFLGAQTVKLQSQQQESSSNLIHDNPLGILSGPEIPQNRSSISPKNQSSALASERDASSISKQQRPSEPVPQTSPKRESRQPSESSQSQQRSQQQSGRDFAISQIISMGFDVESAGAALDASGQDVEAAIEMLIQNSRAEKQIKKSTSPSSPSRSKFNSSSAGTGSHHVGHDDDVARSDSRRSAQANSVRRTSGETASGGVDTQKLMTAASAIGLSVLKNAKNMLDYSKKKITQVIDKALDDGGGVSGTDRRMRFDTTAPGYSDTPPDGYTQWNGEDAEDDDDNDRHVEDGPDEGFSGLGQSPSGRDRFPRHGDDREAPSHRVTSVSQSHNSTASTSPTHASVFSHQPVSSHISTAAIPVASDLLINTDGPDLFSDAGPTISSLPVRSGILASQFAQPSASKAAASASAIAATTASAPVSKPASPSKQVEKPTVQATPEQLSSSNTAKERGNELFKQGQFGEADTFYTRAIESLPTGHALLAVLYNNRAAARLKTGHYKEAVSDCDAVQAVGSSDLKSLLRRATAYEAMEKWESAREDYRAIMAVDPNVKGASAGLARCSKAVKAGGVDDSHKSQGGFGIGVADMGGLTLVAHAASGATTPSMRATGGGAGTSSAVSSPPKPATVVNANVQGAIDQAVTKLRNQTQQAEQEETLKLALKDQVDDRINQWRRSKEDNLRALVSTLDTVLWPELNWKPILLSELISPQQVKSRYLRAVGKVHPDKIAMDATVEHRLIANSVFSTLNRAWDAFKTQNGIS